MRRFKINIQTSIFWAFLILGVFLILSFHILKQRKKVEEVIIKEETQYKIGNVNVDTEKNTIQFTGRIIKNHGWVQFLIYVHGYKWLKEESAIISEAKLKNLQNAIAFLDWELWDELWYRKNQKSKTRNQELNVFITCDGKEIPAHKLILRKDILKTGEFIFLGSPYFDHIVLEDSPGVDCARCPIFPLEEKALREMFTRESGESGYTLNSAHFPSKGKEVTIIIRYVNHN